MRMSERKAWFKASKTVIWIQGVVMAFTHPKRFVDLLDRGFESILREKFGDYQVNRHKETRTK